MMNGPFIRYKNFNGELFRFVTMRAFERQTDGRTDGETERDIDSTVKTLPFLTRDPSRPMRFPAEVGL